MAGYNVNPGIITAGVRVFAIASFVFLGAVFVSYVRMLFLRRKLPPGPFPLLIVGNVLQLQKSKPWLQFQKWSQEYGDGLLTIWIGRTPTIFCNDAWSASDFLEKRSNIYSSRPNYVVFGDVSGQLSTNQVLLPHNDHWRRQRRVMANRRSMSPLALERCASTEVSKPDESKVMMLEILNNPRDFDMGFERYSCSLMSILGWGRRIASKGDYTLKLAIKMMDDITMMQVPGEYWMEAIPEMQYLPTWIYPLPAQIRAFGKKLRKYWWALDLEGAEANEPNFSKTLVKSKEEYGLSQDDIGEMTTNLIGGGLDTSSSTLHSCILALCVFKEVQQKAQEEIDRVIGHDRTPDWADLDNLPYCNAIFKETMRWRSVTTLGGFAHSPIRDDYYRGFFFPAGTHVYGNLWAIHRDPKDFPDLDVFKPERFLEGNRLSYPNKQGHNAFGWARRSCSGKPFAEQGLPMSIVRLLWSFHIQPGLNERGEEVKLDIFAYTDNENTRPQPFPASFTPRSEKIKELLVNDASAARERLRKYDGETKVTVEQFAQR